MNSGATRGGSGARAPPKQVKQPVPDNEKVFTE